MQIDAKQAREIENINALSHGSYTGVSANILSLSSGGAFYAGNDDFFSQVVGWGFSPVPGEIERIESFYRERGCPFVGIEYCSLANKDELNNLLDRGYRFSEMNNVSIFTNFSSLKFADKHRDVSVEICPTERLEEWSSVVAKGFDFIELRAFFLRYARLPNVVPLAAFFDGKMVGGGTMALGDGTICDLAMGSTLAEFRSKGVQKALLMAALQFAAEKNFKMAVTITEAGSVSDNNMRKVGFSTAYSRFKLTRSFV